MIRRRTRGGTITLLEAPDPSMRCGCGRETPPAPGPDALIGLRSEVAQGQHDGHAIELAICPDCLATAIAVHLGRQHVAAGGALDDLDPGAPS